MSKRPIKIRSGKERMMQMVVQATARLMGKTAGGIVFQFMETLMNRTAANDAARSPRSARLRARTRSMEHRVERMFALLGRTCYRLTDQGKNFLDEKMVIDLIERIKTCRTELQRSN